MIKKFKELTSVVAFDDGAFISKTKGTVLLVGVVSRLDNRIEGIVSTSVEIDGLDSTKKIVKLLKKSKFLPQISLIFLQGTNFAGFNLVDLQQLNEKLGLPVVVVFKKKPDMKKIKIALENFSDYKKRVKLFENYPEIHKQDSLYFQFIGIDKATVVRIIKKCCLHSTMPEPIRLAHLIASGVSRGESTRP